MVVDLFPLDSCLGINGQASLNEISGLVGDVDAGEVRTDGFDLLEDLVVTDSVVGIFAVKELVVYHTE
jgi:hypothetical protein